METLSGVLLTYIVSTDDVLGGIRTSEGSMGRQRGVIAVTAAGAVVALTGAQTITAQALNIGSNNTQKVAPGNSARLVGNNNAQGVDGTGNVASLVGGNSTQGVAGTGNTVSLVGNNDNLVAVKFTIPFGQGSTMVSASNPVGQFVAGENNSVSLVGNSGGQLLIGSSNLLSIAGDRDFEVVIGSGNRLSIRGNDDALASFSAPVPDPNAMTNNTVSVAGNNDNVFLGTSGNTVRVVGNSDLVALTTAGNQTVNIIGSGITCTASC